ncbi:MAG: PD40 domain-containing protein [Bacteroidetes bacterium]|nr:PD40 domain-containing protein [Bacteroidota bacterium]
MFKQILFLVMMWNFCSAQLPNTDLWLFKIKNEKGKLSLQKGENITKREGYDNQPAFSEDGKSIYYVSIREDKQADIYIYNIANQKILQQTKTPESEYSPTLSSDKKFLLCVTVLQDSSQVIYPVPLKDGRTGTLTQEQIEKNIFSAYDSIGYFTFLNTDTVLYYKLTNPHSLRAFSISNGTDIFIGNNPARGFKTINRNEFIFGIKDSTQVTFYKYNTLSSKANYYCKYNTLSEDIIWHPGLGLIKSEGALLLYFNEKENVWQQLFDFSTFGIKKITRFTFDKFSKQLVIVDNL